MLRSTLGAILVFVALSASLTACSSHRPTGPTTILVSIEHCGSGWSSPHPGLQTFVLSNEDMVAGEVFLVSAATGDVVAYVDNVAPDATARLPINLGSGRYQFRCAMSDRDVATGQTVVVRGNSPGATAPVAAVTEHDLVPVAQSYQTYVLDALPGLRLRVAALAADLDSGNLALARTDWLQAHLAYQRLGGAYGAFGDLATAADGTTVGLSAGVSDPSFTGFHRIEYGLWHGQSSAQLAPFGIDLVQTVDALSASVADSRISPLEVGIRAHEIAEDVLRFDLTGQTDYGSGTALASAGAELDGTLVLLRMLSPLLRSRYPALDQTTSRLQLTQSDIADLATNGGSPPLSSLATADRERVDSDVSQLATLLAPIASICEPRTTG